MKQNRKTSYYTNRAIRSQKSEERFDATVLRRFTSNMTKKKVTMLHCWGAV